MAEDQVHAYQDLCTRGAEKVLLLLTSGPEPSSQSTGCILTILLHQRFDRIVCTIELETTTFLI